MRTPIVKVASKSLAGALALLVLTWAGQAQASGGTAATRIIAASVTLDNSQEGFLISRGSVDRSCSVSLASGGRQRGQSASRRPGRAGELEFVWRFPAATSDGTWLAQLRCRGQRSLVRRITLHGGHAHARASGRHSIAIKVIVVSSTRAPQLVEPPARGAKGGGAYPPYGTVILPGSQWFGGHGVNVFSDGADGGTGFYQCVELFERFINTEGWYHGIAGAGIIGANQLFGAVPSSSFDKHPNGSGYIPVPGDAVIFSGLTFGHVAIVDYVSGGHVGLVEQNAAPSGRTSISLSGSTLGKDGPYLSVIGVLHAKADHQASGGEPVPAPAPTPAGGPIFTVMNTSETLPDGVYFRNSPHTSDTSHTAGIGVFAGEQVRLLCYAFGDSVGPYNDALWYDVSNVTRATSNGASNVGWLNAHYVNDGKPANQVDAGVPLCAGYPSAVPSGPAPGPSPESAPSPAPAPPPTYGETSGGVVHTWTNYSNAGGAEGPQIPSNATVQIACKVPGFRVADGNTWWYRIASGPWNGAYYGSADAFYNNGATSGSLKGTPFVDPNVPNC